MVVDCDINDGWDAHAAIKKWGTRDAALTEVMSTQVLVLHIDLLEDGISPILPLIVDIAGRGLPQDARKIRTSQVGPHQGSSAQFGLAEVGFEGPSVVKSGPSSVYLGHVCEFEPGM